jgi:Fur family transcriptional regulator, ferric uptake regulator
MEKESCDKAGKRARNTRQKQLILNVIRANSGRHMSAEDIYELVKQSDKDIGIATVYRNIKTLEEDGVLLKAQFNERDGAKYEMCLQVGDHTHHHLICMQCGAVYDVEDDLLDKIEKLVSSKRGFKILDHRLNFYGICRECQEKGEG